jgi:hypothetical protein
MFRIFVVSNRTRSVCVEVLDLQVVVHIGHIGTVLKCLPVTGFCFVVLALHTQDVSKVPVRCSAKQKQKKHYVRLCPQTHDRMPTIWPSTQPEKKASY